MITKYRDLFHKNWALQLLAYPMSFILAGSGWGFYYNHHQAFAYVLFGIIGLFTPGMVLFHTAPMTLRSTVSYLLQGVGVCILVGSSILAALGATGAIPFRPMEIAVMAGTCCCLAARLRLLADQQAFEAGQTQDKT